MLYSYISGLVQDAAEDLATLVTHRPFHIYFTRKEMFLPVPGLRGRPIYDNTRSAINE